MIMKKFILSGMFLALAVIWVSGISPYVKLTDYDGPMNEAVGMVTSLLEQGGYEIIGQYQPGENSDLYVLVFTSDRGMLAAAMKVGFQLKEEKVAVFLAEFDNFEQGLAAIQEGLSRG
jgi:hypothetical protein